MEDRDTANNTSSLVALHGFFNDGLDILLVKINGHHTDGSLQKWRMKEDC